MVGLTNLIQRFARKRDEGLRHYKNVETANSGPSATAKTFGNEAIKGRELAFPIKERNVEARLRLH